MIFQGPFQPSFKKPGCISLFKLLTLDNSLSLYPDPRQEGVSAAAGRVLATAFLPLPSSGCNSPLAQARQPDREANKCPKESKFLYKLSFPDMPYKLSPSWAAVTPSLVTIFSPFHSAKVKFSVFTWDLDEIKR